MTIFNPDRLKNLQSSSQHQKKHTVLVVDDETGNLRLIEGILEDDYNVLTAKNGLEGLDIINNLEKPNEIQLIVTDQRMPHMSGVDFLIEAREKLPLAKSIVVTAYTDVQVIIDSVNNAHIYKFILKPFDNDDFLLTVKRAVEAYVLEDRTRKLNHKLAWLNNNLEEEISERTRELNMANQQLRLEIEDRLEVQAENEKLIEKLQDALDNVKELKDLLPICSNCKKIRDDTGYWNQLESYFHKFSDISFTHAMCPECMEQLYGKYDWFKKSEDKLKDGAQDLPELDRDD